MRFDLAPREVNEDLGLQNLEGVEPGTNPGDIVTDPIIPEPLSDGGITSPLSRVFETARGHLPSRQQALAALGTASMILTGGAIIKEKIASAASPRLHPHSLAFMEKYCKIVVPIDRGSGKPSNHKRGLSATSVVSDRDNPKGATVRYHASWNPAKIQYCGNNSSEGNNDFKDVYGPESHLTSHSVDVISPPTYTKEAITSIRFYARQLNK